MWCCVKVYDFDMRESRRRYEYPQLLGGYCQSDELNTIENGKFNLLNVREDENGIYLFLHSEFAFLMMVCRCDRENPMFLPTSPVQCNVRLAVLKCTFREKQRENE